MLELIASNPVPFAALLAAAAMILNRIGELLKVVAERFGPLLGAITDAIRAWAKKTNNERHCEARLAEAMSQIAALRAELDALRAEIEGGAAPISSPTHVVEEHVREPSGEQRLPAGVPPLPQRPRRQTR